MTVTKRVGLLAIALAVLVWSECFGQTISGPRTAKPGDLVVLSPVDAENARTFWNLNSPESFDQFAEEGGKLFLAMPPQRISFSLFVIPNDTALPIRQIRHSIEPTAGGGGGGNPPTNPNEPGQPNPPPAVESPMAKVSAEAFAKIDAAAKGPAMAVAAVFRDEADRIEAGRYQDVPLAMASLAERNSIALGVHRQAWQDWRLAIAKGLGELETAGKLPDVKSHAVHWRAIAEGLR